MESNTRLINALHDFSAETKDELTFHVGDVFTVLDDKDPDWYVARHFQHKDRVGLVS